MEACRSVHTAAAGAARRNDQLHRTDERGVSPAFEAGRALGQATTQRNMVGQDREKLASSDGARVANLDGESLEVFGRRTICSLDEYGIQ